MIGEAVHFIDTIQYLDGSGLESLAVTYADYSAYPKKDNAAITLRFTSGAIGTVLYTSMGSRKYPKEQLRVFSNGAVYEMDHYAVLRKYGSSKKTEVRLKQDKGIRNEYQYIYNVLKGKKINDSIEQAMEAHRLLFAAIGK